ncbi:MAG: Asp-tRNA(Asn) amidotransferase subunit GatC [Sulfolobaceae archaeon]|nr:Asp-tRNA(Asn) amidotransferase subunit GatC [Sulfolobaceae archaeon]
MKIEVNKELIKKLETLSLIQLTEEERERMVNDIKKILDFFDKIDELNLENVEPLFHPIRPEKLRKDKPLPSLSIEEALQNVKRKQENFIIGPKTYGE